MFYSRFFDLSIRLFVIMDKRIVGIDILKVFAVILVLNSHMSICYGKYSFLSTGGAFGDSLFFFSSGFTLFLGRSLRFDNWYKRRIARIYPSVLAVAIVSCCFWGNVESIGEILTGKKYWFLGCILIYYALIYPIREYGKHLKAIFIISMLFILLIYYAAFDYDNNGLIYSGGIFRWFLFFLFMLQGAIIGKNVASYSFKQWHLGMLFLCVISWYAILYLYGSSSLQILSVIPLLGVSYYSYMVASAPFFRNLYQTKWGGNILFIMGSLCLEVYLVQRYLFTDAWNDLFPLNIPIIMLMVFIVAYGVKMFSEWISQTFKSEPYDWKAMLIYKKEVGG